MKIRVSEYNENVVGFRVAHIDFYMENGGYVACPFTKGEVEFSKQLANECEQADKLRAIIGHKDDALDSYAEFYQKCATLAGLPDDCNPCSEADEIIASKIGAYERLTARVSELVEQADTAYAPYRQMVIDARTEVDKTSQKLFETRSALHNLVEACHRADNDGELASAIDGALMDEAWRVLKQ